MRRFISGAICPKCQSAETLYLETTAEEAFDSVSEVPREVLGDRLYCTRCNYTDTRDQANSLDSDQEIETIRII